jgi:hypothetical protein
MAETRVAEKRIAMKRMAHIQASPKEGANVKRQAPKSLPFVFQLTSF